MVPLVRSAVFAALLVPIAAAVTQAHGGASAFIVVPADHVVPGQPFDVVASDMGPDTEIRLTIKRGESVVPLETVRAASDGHFRGSVTLPADLPEGYAELVASGTDGTRAATWILVSGLPQSTTVGVPAAWWADPSVIVLALFMIGALAVLGYLALRSKRPGHARAKV